MAALLCRHRIMDRNPRDIPLAIVLRSIAAFDLLAVGAIVMPASWMASTHAWLGLGELTPSPVFLYLARSVSMLYAFHGVTLWFIAGDVRRYRPLIAFFGPLTVACVPLFVLVDALAGLPPWWIIGEAACVAAMGFAMVVMDRRLDGVAVNGSSDRAPVAAPDREELSVGTD
jgi:hypothetical protein